MTPVDVISGSGDDILSVGTSPKSTCVSLYDGLGVPLVGEKQAVSRGALRVQTRQGAATGAGAAVWAVRNASASHRLLISRVALQFSFDGTGAATLMRYELIKGYQATALSGGTVVVPMLVDQDAISLCVDARVLETGLTVTNVVWGASLWTGTHNRRTPSATAAAPGDQREIIEWPTYIELRSNEVLAIRNGPTNASVIGDSIFGRVVFVERLP